MDLWQAGCEDMPSPACEHAVPSSKAGIYNINNDMLTRTIAETNMALWALDRPGQL